MEDVLVLPHLGATADCENLSQGKEPTFSKIGEIKRNIYGYKYDERDNKKEYTVLLFGASKCGKSTVIDFVANFFKKIILPKNGLFYVTRDNLDKLDKTDKEALCFYTFCTKDTVFNFIDSPSINNESGFVDAKRKEIFQKSIYEIKENNIKIHAVGFVIQNHFVRLGPAEENMLRFVTGLLGENIANLIPFITYADANTPPVLEALQIFKIDTGKHLVFNNVCLNTTIDKITKLSEIYWEDGLENIQKGIDIIMKLEPIDLVDISLEKLSIEDKKEPSTFNAEEIEEGLDVASSLDHSHEDVTLKEYTGDSNSIAPENKIEKLIRETYDIYTKRDCKICGRNHYLEFKNTRGPKLTQLQGILPKLSRCTTCEHEIHEHTYVYIDCKEVVKLTIERIKTDYNLRNDAEVKRVVRNWVPKESEERYKEYGELILEHLWWDDFHGACKRQAKKPIL